MVVTGPCGDQASLKQQDSVQGGAPGNKILETSLILMNMLPPRNADEGVPLRFRLIGAGPNYPKDTTEYQICTTLGKIKIRQEPRIGKL